MQNTVPVYRMTQCKVTPYQFNKLNIPHVFIHIILYIALKSYKTVSSQMGFREDLEHLPVRSYNADNTQHNSSRRRQRPQILQTKRTTIPTVHNSKRQSPTELERTDTQRVNNSQGRLSTSPKSPTKLTDYEVDNHPQRWQTARHSSCPQV